MECSTRVVAEVCFKQKVVGMNECDRMAQLLRRPPVYLYQSFSKMSKLALSLTSSLVSVPHHAQQRENCLKPTLTLAPLGPPCREKQSFLGLDSASGAGKAPESFNHFLSDGTRVGL